MFFGNPIPVWLLTIAYLVFVVYAGPKFMKNRKPYSLQSFMVVYNLGLVILSIYMFAEVIIKIHGHLVYIIIYILLLPLMLSG